MTRVIINEDNGLIIPGQPHGGILGPDDTKARLDARTILNRINDVARSGALLS